MIHRAVISTMERMMSYLIELYGGAFPVWLAPVQAIVLPISDRHAEYARDGGRRTAKPGPAREAGRAQREGQRQDPRGADAEDPVHAGGGRSRAQNGTVSCAIASTAIRGRSRCPSSWPWPRIWIATESARSNAGVAKRNRKKPLVATPEPVASPPVRRWARLWPYLALAALAFLVYSNALSNGFAADDDSQLLSNPLVVNYREIPRIFGQDIWAFSKPVGATPSNYYRPIQILLYMALYYVGNFNPVWFHTVMLLIHVANTLLVFRLGLFFLKNSEHAKEIALAAAALFAVHPIHNEAVVWVAVLPDIFMTLLALVMILLFVLQDARPTPRQIAVHAALFLVALFTKETAVVLLPLLAGYEWLYLGRDARQIWANRNFYIA
jgi:hypothetical protein